MSEPNSMPVSEYGMLDEDIERIPIKDLFKKQRTYTEVTQLLHDTKIASVTFFDWAADQCIITLKDGTSFGCDKVTVYNITSEIKKCGEPCKDINIIREPCGISCI